MPCIPIQNACEICFILQLKWWRLWEEQGVTLLLGVQGRDASALHDHFAAHHGNIQYFSCVVMTVKRKNKNYINNFISDVILCICLSIPKFIYICNICIHTHTQVYIFVCISIYFFTKINFVLHTPLTLVSQHC